MAPGRMYGPAGAVKEIDHALSDDRTVVTALDQIRLTLEAGREVDWERRVQALQRLRTLSTLVMTMTGRDSVRNAFNIQLATLKKGLASQVGDLRSAVVRETCETLAELAERLGDRAGELLIDKTIILALLKTSIVTIQVVWMAGADAMRRILHSTKIGPAAVAALAVQSTSTSITTRDAVAEYLGILLDRSSRSELDRSIHVIATAIAHGVQDPKLDVRQRSRKNFCLLELMYPERAREIFAGLTTSTQNAIRDEASDDLVSRTRPPRRSLSTPYTTSPVPPPSSRRSSTAKATTPLSHVKSQPAGRVLVTTPTATTSSSPQSTRSISAGRVPVSNALRPSTSSSSPSSSSAAAATTAAAAAAAAAAKRLSVRRSATKMFEEVVLLTRYGNRASVTDAVRSLAEWLVDPYADVVAAALRSLAELLQRGVDIDLVLEGSPYVFARVLVLRRREAMRNSEGIRSGVRLVMAAVRRRLGNNPQRWTSLVLAIVRDNIAGKLTGDVNGEDALSAFLPALGEVLAASAGGGGDMGGEVLVEIDRVMRDLGSARSAEVRKEAAKVLRDACSFHGRRETSPHHALADAVADVALDAADDCGADENDRRPLNFLEATKEQRKCELDGGEADEQRTERRTSWWWSFWETKRDDTDDSR